MQFELSDLVNDLRKPTVCGLIRIVCENILLSRYDIHIVYNAYCIQYNTYAVDRTFYYFTTIAENMMCSCNMNCQCRFIQLTIFIVYGLKRELSVFEFISTRGNSL